MKTLILSLLLIFPSSCAHVAPGNGFKITTFDQFGKPVAVYDVDSYKLGQDQVEITVRGKAEVIKGSFQVEEK